MSATPQTKEIWDIIKETQKNIKNLSVETDKLRDSQKKLSAETNKQIKETNQGLKETNEGLKKAKGLFETQWGKLMESLVEGDLVNILNEKGIAVKNTYMNIKSKFEEDQYEYDIVAGNGAEKVVVEVKTTLRVKHVKQFLEDITKFRGRLSVSKNKTIYGAVAYLRVEEEAEKFAEKNGLFVVRATGDSASIINKKDFKPKVYS
ncbi:MAG: hypothetical protein OXJ52_05870 [Oligoflexia bacterium]|nr:hypothetical protein [Oligoflexia bacterium]